MLPELRVCVIFLIIFILSFNVNNHVLNQRQNTQSAEDSIDFIFELNCDRMSIAFEKLICIQRFDIFSSSWGRCKLAIGRESTKI